MVHIFSQFESKVVPRCSSCSTGFLVIVIRRDIVWCVAATWICASIWSLKPKPYPVFVRVECLYSIMCQLGTDRDVVHRRGVHDTPSCRACRVHYLGVAPWAPSCKDGSNRPPARRGATTEWCTCRRAASTRGGCRSYLGISRGIGLTLH